MGNNQRGMQHAMEAVLDAVPEEVTEGIVPHGVCETTPKVKQQLCQVWRVGVVYTILKLYPNQTQFMTHGHCNLIFIKNPPQKRGNSYIYEAEFNFKKGVGNNFWHLLVSNQMVLSLGVQDWGCRTFCISIHFMSFWLVSS